MAVLNQKTLKKEVSFYGIGLHSGNKVNLKVKPANPNTGIIFKRVDLNLNNFIYPNFENVSNTSLNTTKTFYSNIRKHLNPGSKIFWEGFCKR